jgi:hypothetical protein
MRTTLGGPSHGPVLRIAQATGAALTVLTALTMSGCGGSSSNPFDNPSTVDNSPGSSSGQRLSFAYFQKCINPIFLAQLPIVLNGETSTNTCAGTGCHATATGTGGAFRVVPGAAVVDLTNPANTPDVIRASDMYKNFYSAQGEIVVGSPTQSRLLVKPQLLNVLHGGGLIFPSATDPNVKLIEYWISHPAPQGQDEFGTATYSMFTPADPVTGTCNTQ